MTIDLSPSDRTFNFETILIVCYGRSGSTLLQGILNSINGVHVKGENGNVFHYFYLAYKDPLWNSKRFIDSDKSTHPWFGSCWFDEQEYLRDLRCLARNLLISGDSSQTQRISALGFKEIRYASMEDPIPYIQFLLSLFPSPCILHLTRNHTDVAGSQAIKLKNKKDIPVPAIRIELERFDSKMRLFSAEPYYFHIDYQDLIAPDKEALKKLFDFLGAKLSAEAIARVLQERHSY